MCVIKKETFLINFVLGCLFALRLKQTNKQTNQNKTKQYKTNKQTTTTKNINKLNFYNLSGRSRLI